MICVVRQDASNLLHDGSLAPIVSNQVDEPRCHKSSHPQSSIVLQCDVSIHTMIDVSDRFADNRNGQFGFQPSKMEAVITEQSSAAKCSVDRSVSGLCSLFALADCNRSSGACPFAMDAALQLRCAVSPLGWICD